MRELLDQYAIVAYDFDIGHYYKHNAKYFFAIFDELDTIKKGRGDLSDSVFPVMVETLVNMEEKRNRMSVLHQERLSVGQWLILIFLAVVIIFSLFYLRTDMFYSQIITVGLGSVLVLVLLITRDLQNLRLGGEALAEESGEELFEFIGKPRYYNKIYIDQGVVQIPSHVTEYRLGLHRPGEEQNIVVVKNA